MISLIAPWYDEVVVMAMGVGHRSFPMADGMRRSLSGIVPDNVGLLIIASSNKPLKGSKL